jgi:hypothetical protein
MHGVLVFLTDKAQWQEQQQQQQSGVLRECRK